jgi:hypothetical protein
MTKTERWLNLIAFLLDHRHAAARRPRLIHAVHLADVRVAPT